MDCIPDYPEVLDRIALDSEYVAQRHGFERKSTGDFRTVFQAKENNEAGLDAGCIVKLGEQQLQNRREYEQWEKAQGTELESHLVPVSDIGADGAWLTMEAADTEGISGEDSERFDSELRSDGWVCFDTISENIGRHNGKLKLFDYHKGCKRITE